MAARLVARFLNWPAATSLFITGTVLIVAGRFTQTRRPR